MGLTKGWPPYTYLLPRLCLCTPVYSLTLCLCTPAHCLVLGSWFYLGSGPG